MEIAFWGTRGSIASPGPETIIYGGNTTCLSVTLGSGRTVILDAGTGIRKLGDALLEKGGCLDVDLLITHIHWDHVLGFPFFGPVFRDTTRIAVDGFSRGIDGLRYLFSNRLLDGTWPLKFEQLEAKIVHETCLQARSKVIDGTRVESHPLQHPQGGLGFKFTDDSGTFVFLTDNELMDQGWRGTGFKDFVDFCRGADLLVHDCQYLPEEMETRRGWGHSDAVSVARLAIEAEVKRLVLFHHDPWRTDRGVDGMVERCKEICEEKGASFDVEGARENSTIRL